MNKEIKGLNGLRAISVILVLIYHFYPRLMQAGFLGVDFFFVLSGYLITSILINEIDKTNTLDIKRFYYKRIKRLIPLSYFMLMLVVIILGFTNHNWLMKERLSILNSFVYNLNLYNLIASNNYFDSFNLVSPVKHLWSLAIEMKFYILFPILFLFTKDRKKLRSIFISLIAVSIVLNIFIYFNYRNSLNIVYNSLFTRMYAILVGSTLATFIDLKLLRNRKVSKISYLFLILTIVSMVLLDEHILYNYQFIYFYSIVFAFILIGLANSKILEPLNYLGNISYGIYIFHFAIFSLTTPFEEYASPNLLFVIVRVLITILLSMFTYHYIENPIRIYGFKEFLKKPINLISTLILTVLTVVMLSGVNLEFMPYRLISNDEVGSKILELDLNQINIEKEEEKPTLNNEVIVDEKPVEENIYRNVLLIGDSVGINISYALEKLIPYLEVDAQTGRYLFDAITIADKYQEYNTNDSAVLILLGTNGPIKEKEVYEICEKFSNADVYFANINIPRSWNDKVNNVLKSSVENIDNAYLIDWNKKSKNHREYFRKDRVHVNEKGAVAFIEEIQNSLRKEIDVNSQKESKFHIIHELRNKTNKKK